MLIKRIIFLVLFLCFFFSMTQASLIDTNKNELEMIPKLTDDVLQFETQFYNSVMIDSLAFTKGVADFERLMGLLISFDSQYPDSNFANKAFIYLEKLKNLKLFSLFKVPEYPKFRGNQPFNYNLLQDSGKFSTSGKELLLFMQKPVDIENLQKNFLKDKEALLDFWIKENKIFVFVLTEDSLQIVHWSAPIQQIKERINKLISTFYREINLLKLEFDHQISLQIYLDIFQPLEEHIQHTKVIFIIPDDFLIGFPFEFLVTDTTISKKNKNDLLYNRYSHLVYLINKYAMCYNYSTAVFATVPYQDRTTKKLGRRLLTMSEPIVPKNKFDLLPQIGNLNSYDFQISEYSANEIKRVSRLLFRHDNLKKEQITKTYLVEKGHTYRWLYFALPGILDNLNPRNSGILFSHEMNDSSFVSNWLSVDETMQINLSADLLSLSASRLKTFNSDGNPGVMALPQSFLFSGVKSVLFSLWRINSISTSQFMSKFYWELKYKRQTNAIALQEAKLASMKDTFIFSGKEISRAHPYFWATFMLIGNPKIRPPSPTKIPLWGFVIIVYIVVIVVSLYITRKTLPGRK